MAEETTKTRKPREQDAGEGEVASVLHDEQQQGYRGYAPDPTPNENYTLAGVTSGKPTPETDPSLREEARRSLDVTGAKVVEGDHKRELKRRRDAARKARRG